ncbi:unnamed protein product [Paramecium primaurelia]|uniref:Uncharacterized protein n=1 Tax=Paramecium primaurelia TaxID=5886 RepID=A0A8S1Q984_PARPR|nr:unnamed protein product [Paramecium primaurelia]
MLVNQMKCMFYQKLRNDGLFHLILKRALYCKYSQSQNFFYEKHINDKIEDQCVKCNINYKDHLKFNDQNEHMQAEKVKIDCQPYLNTINIISIYLEISIQLQLRREWKEIGNYNIVKLNKNWVSIKISNKILHKKSKIPLRINLQVK